MKNLQQSLTRSELEFKAAAVIELKKRRSVCMTIFGVVCPVNGLVRCWQDQGGKFVEVEGSPDVSIPLKLERALITPKPIKVIYGSRGSGKSENIASIMSAKVKDYGRKVGAFREYQNSIEDSVHSIIAKKISSSDLQGFVITDNKITHENGGAVKYRGLARNPEGIKSMDDFDDFWIEEAATISARSLETLEPTIRNDDAEIWYSLNKGSSADPISQEHLVPYERELARDGYYEDDHVLVIEINYQDNPFFPSRLETQRKKNEQMWSKAKYDHVWGGQYYDEIENSIIPTEWFDAAIDAHKKLNFKARGAKIVSHDPSDLGDDPKGLVYRHGSIIKDALEKIHGDVNQGCDWATEYAINISADNFVWDCDGLGVTLRRQVSDSFSGKACEFVMFKGSEGVDDPDDYYQPDKKVTNGDARTNKQTFRNKRAQYYWRLRDRFYNTWLAVENGEYIDPDEMISLSSDIECMAQLRAEVCRIPKKPNGNGLIQIMSKPDMLSKHQIKSPNLADSLMMSIITPTLSQSWSGDINYKSGSIA